MLKFSVKRCVHTAIKLRKKYFYKVCLFSVCLDFLGFTDVSFSTYDDSYHYKQRRKHRHRKVISANGLSDALQQQCYST